ncbi:hydrolase [Gaoshiqia sediminis]|uniref:Uncharacterized protein n=1 Tax=Gaoshiqia sediminis TaxID=2986998 RepID=A0AA41YB00_9BACT|nr:hydrolase [Gaoshiqia sediminis]MCW0482798.1 hypothetical protein [Gaoshiqia sediminis]
MNTNETNSDVCCPPFDPAPWDDRVLEWKHKMFIRDKVFTLFYMPMNFAKVIKRLYKKVQTAQTAVPENLCLSDHTSKWNMDLYLAVGKPVKGAKNISLSGHFYSKVYEGPYKNTQQWCDDYKKLAEQKGLEIKKWYMWYTTCPKCAKKYGKNYVVILCHVSKK